jgi:hypothetical protein
MHKNWSKFFYLAAFWNISAALKALIDIDDNATNFYLSKASEVTPILITNLSLWWWTVFSFGIGYLLVAKNPLKNHGIIFLAAFGKIFVGGLWINGYFVGQVKLIALLGGCGDILFAGVFIYFLYKYRHINS